MKKVGTRQVIPAKAKNPDVFELSIPARQP
jgi:hypothetical protein